MLLSKSLYKIGLHFSQNLGQGLSILFAVSLLCCLGLINLQFDVIP